MDLDVFGPSISENKVVIIGEDNVVIVKSKEAETASNEEIPKAIYELKIETQKQEKENDIGKEKASVHNAPIDLTMEDTPQKKVFHCLHECWFNYRFIVCRFEDYILIY
jgi:hypothetical protein